VPWGFHPMPAPKETSPAIAAWKTARRAGIAAPGRSPFVSASPDNWASLPRRWPSTGNTSGRSGRPRLRVATASRCEAPSRAGFTRRDAAQTRRRGRPRHVFAGRGQRTASSCAHGRQGPDLAGRGCIEDQPQRVAGSSTRRNSMRAAAGRGRHSRAPGFSDRL
jgi:hypothetical protein